MRFIYCLFFISVLKLSWACPQSEKQLLIQKELTTEWFFTESGSEDWYPAKIPGCIHTDLMLNGIIQDPFYRLNERNVQWIDKEDWEYKTSFYVGEQIFNKDKVVLSFKGLDTYADVFVNGIKIGSADNMFREWEMDVKNQLIKNGNNELLIHFFSPIVEGIKKYDNQGYVIPVSDNDLAELGKVEGAKKVSIYTRKAGYHFGWDWGPRIVTSGIWRPVFLKAWDELKINKLQIIQNSVSDKKAEMTAVFEIEALEEKVVNLLIENGEAQLANVELELKKGVQTYPVEFSIEQPKLWWTNGLGEQYLYDIKGEIAVGEYSISLTERIGIRELEFVREKDEYGTSFYFKLNGVPVFIKGANYIPNDIFPARVSNEKYKNVVNTAKISNMNMLRVWGGGIYENDLFYDLCDEAGVLVWQDFMFACAMYPGDENFLENVRHEAIDNIKRLRNHPCIALWCGNNEIIDAWLGWGWKKKEEQKNPENAKKIWKAYEDIFHRLLPKLVEKFDNSRSYWSSSPSAGEGIKANQSDGDEHYWGVWWQKHPFTEYKNKIARFMSEYGFQSFPEFKSIRQYAKPEDFDIYSDVMMSHQRSSIGNETIDYYLLGEYKKPKDFKSFLYVNQVLQAEGVNIAMEAHRRAMPYCMGTLYWQINDCWPVASWSSTDYYQRWKALQYFVKKAYAPILVSPFWNKDLLEVYVVSDKLQKIAGKLKIRMMDFDGKIVWSKLLNVEIPANSSSSYFHVNKSELVKNFDETKLLLDFELVEKDQVIAKNRIYFLPTKELSLQKTDIRYTVDQIENGFELRLESDKLAKNVFLTLDEADGFFSDNFFDLLAHEPVIIRLDTPISKDSLVSKLSISSLVESFGN